MTRASKKLIIANWKMNPLDLAHAKDLFIGVKETARTLSKVQTVIAPPFVYLSELSKLFSGHRIALSSQDVFWEKRGSFTGEVSPAMLKDIRVGYSIVGHSERRGLGESDEDVHKKIEAVTKEGITAIVCIGESDRDHTEGTHLAFLTAQIETAFRDVKKSSLSKIVVAYEPIWAIGKSEADAMKPHELHETVLFIKKILASLYGKQAGFKIPIVYGGSVEKNNTAVLLVEGMVDGLLVGHASLSVKEFTEIMRIAQKV
ncbi:MAG: triose-phosphate isomerase [Candidatus Paceibacterota bacterium]